MGNPNNTSNTPMPLGSLTCGQGPLTIGTGGTTANDGSNAWYQVDFTQNINATCRLSITIAGTPGAVFDLIVLPNPSLTPFVSQVSGTVSAPVPSPAATEQLLIHVYDNVPSATPASGPFSLTVAASSTGNPNNTSDTPMSLGSLTCGQGNQTIGTSGTTANDGSNAWYRVDFTENFIGGCRLSITIAGGTPGAVFDLIVLPNPSLTTFVSQVSGTVPGPVPSAGATEQLLIHVYDNAGSAPASGPFSLTVAAM
jgi:hypothetical protein